MPDYSTLTAASIAEHRSLAEVAERHNVHVPLVPQQLCALLDAYVERNKLRGQVAEWEKLALQVDKDRDKADRRVAKLRAELFTESARLHALYLTVTGDPDAPKKGSVYYTKYCDAARELRTEVARLCAGAGTCVTCNRKVTARFSNGECSICVGA